MRRRERRRGGSRRGSLRSSGLGTEHENENQSDQTEYPAEADPIRELATLPTPDPTPEGGANDSVAQPYECGVVKERIREHACTPRS